jgi:hypothetical protein
VLEAVGLRIEFIPVSAGHLDGEQNMASLGFVALPAGDLDEVKAELGQHRLRNSLQRQGKRSGVESRIHCALGPFAEISSFDRARAVGRFPPRDLGKGSTAQDFLPGGVGPRADRGRIRCEGYPGQRDEAEERGLRTLKLV